MKIKHNSIFTEDGIAKVEEQYNARYICDTCIPAKDGGYTLMSAAVFYGAEAHPDSGSRYFALYSNPLNNTLYIINASWIEDQRFQALNTKEGLVYSVHRHDMAHGDNGEFIDGGRDYLRSNAESFTHFRIVDGEVQCYIPEIDTQSESPALT